MQNLQIESEADIKAIISSLDTLSVSSTIYEASNGNFKQLFDFTVDKHTTVYGHHLDNMSKAGWELSSIRPEKKGILRFNFRKTITQQTVIETEAQT